MYYEHRCIITMLKLKMIGVLLVKTVQCNKPSSFIIIIIIAVHIIAAMQCNAPNHHHHCHHCSTIQCNDAPNFHQARKILSIKLSSSFFSSEHLFQAIDQRAVQSTEQNIAKMQRRTQLVGNGQNTDQNQSEYFTHRCDSCPSWVVGSGHNYIQQVGMYSLPVERQR